LPELALVRTCAEATTSWQVEELSTRRVAAALDELAMAT
jgi:hypothetical protein